MIPVKVMIPTALRQFADGQDTIELEGTRVGQVLRRLGEAYPELKKHLFSDDGELRNFVNVFINDDNIRDKDQQDTLLEAGDELTIVPAIAGGLIGGVRGCLGISGVYPGCPSGVAVYICSFFETSIQYPSSESRMN